MRGTWLWSQAVALTNPSGRLRGGEFIKRAFESQPQSDLTRQRAGVADVVDGADVQLRDHALAGTQRASDRHASSRRESHPHGDGYPLAIVVETLGGR